MTETDARWMAVRALLRSARANDRAMRQADLAPQLRDEATRGYCRDVDALVAELGRLEDAGALPAAPRGDVRFGHRVA